MQVSFDSEEEQLLLSEALMLAAYQMQEDAAVSDRKGRIEVAARERTDAKRLLDWRDEIDEQEV